MVKWAALVLALIALFSAPSITKVAERFDANEQRLRALEGQQCTLMSVLTPSGTKTICAITR